MRAALTYSGQPRDIQRTWQNHKKFLIEPLKKQGFEVDIFCHFWFDETQVGKEYIKGSYLIGNVQDSRDFLTNSVKPLSLVFDKPEKFENTALVPDTRFPHPVNRTLSMFKSWNNVANQLSDYENTNNFEYNLVFRMRTDLVFHKILPEFSKLDLNNVYVLNIFAHLDYGVDDTFAFSNSKNIKSYLNINQNLDEIVKLGAAINPETLLGFYLINYLKIKVKKLNLDIKLFRVSYLRFSKIRIYGEVQKFFYYFLLRFKSNLKKWIQK